MGNIYSTPPRPKEIKGNDRKQIHANRQKATGKQRGGRKVQGAFCGIFKSKTKKWQILK